LNKKEVEIKLDHAGVIYFGYKPLIKMNINAKKKQDN